MFQKFKNSQHTGPISSQKCAQVCRFFGVMKAGICIHIPRNSPPCPIVHQHSFGYPKCIKNKIPIIFLKSLGSDSQPNHLLVVPKYYCGGYHGSTMAVSEISENLHNSSFLL